MNSHFKLITKTDQGSVLYFINSHQGSVLMSVLTVLTSDLVCNGYYHIPVSSQFQILPPASHEKLEMYVTVLGFRLAPQAEICAELFIHSSYKKSNFPYKLQHSPKARNFHKKIFSAQISDVISHQDY